VSFLSLADAVEITFEVNLSSCQSRALHVHFQWASWKEVSSGSHYRSSNWRM